MRIENRLYERIMRKVSRVVKQTLNEGSTEKNPLDCEYVVFTIYYPARYDENDEFDIDYENFFDNKRDCNDYCKKVNRFRQETYDDYEEYFTVYQLEAYSWKKDKSDINDPFEEKGVGETFSAAMKDLRQWVGKAKLWVVDKDGWYK